MRHDGAPCPLRLRRAARCPQPGGRPQTRRAAGPRGRRAPSVRRVRPPARSSDDGDVIRARLRALLAEAPPAGGWVPDDDPTTSRGRRRGDEPAVTGPPVAARPDRTDRRCRPGWAGTGRPGDGAAGPGPAGRLVAVGRRAWSRPSRGRLDLAGPAAGGPGAGAGAAPAHRAADARPDRARRRRGGRDRRRPVVVSVVGQVARRGWSRCPPGSRVADAIEAAGGLLPDADPASVNVAGRRHRRRADRRRRPGRRPAGRRGRRRPPTREPAGWST